VPQGVGEQVGQDTVEQRRVGQHLGKGLRDVEDDVVAAGPQLLQHQR